MQTVSLHEIPCCVSGVALLAEFCVNIAFLSAMCHCVSCVVRLSLQAPRVCVTVSAVSGTDLQAATCHCVSSVCVTVSCEWVTFKQLCHCVSCGWDCLFKHRFVCVTVSTVGEIAPLSTPLYVSLSKLCICHCVSCEGDCPFKHPLCVSLCQLCMCHCVSCEGDCPFKHPFVCHCVSCVCVTVSAVRETVPSSTLCVCHCVSCEGDCPFKHPCVH